LGVKHVTVLDPTLRPAELRTCIEEALARR
jgi:hypothetical protein